MQFVLARLRTSGSDVVGPEDFARPLPTPLVEDALPTPLVEDALPTPFVEDALPTPLLEDALPKTDDKLHRDAGTLSRKIWKS